MRTSAEIPSDGVGRFAEEAAGVDVDLERAVDSIGAGRLLFSIADALAKGMKHPQSAARAYGVLLARLEGQTLDFRSLDVRGYRVNGFGRWFVTFVGS